ncbi:hypothetical protein [Idiomarina sp. HP20-50]|uniref:hypothetical protein n=1 Tax=Idiomarina sp. HP20-50 TaxID=3070813 RepID=UPI00294B5B1A|nr:hypothetical protein [Idiomarina sp. HP20-50]MDV6315317.1 hypothetical protein [Idiomarina sp. HP20-50]
MKVSWLLIAIVLIHSFFTCATAAGHVEDASHSSVDIVFDTNHDLEHRTESLLPDSDIGHEHQFHAHVSCITGYGVNVSASPVITEAQPTPVTFDKSLAHQPPVPPPNA